MRLHKNFINFLYEPKKLSNFFVRRASSNSSQVQCANTLKEGDYEGYLSSLLINKSEIRRFAIAIKCFNLEISRIRDLANSETAAAFRFAFWSDAINEIFSQDGLKATQNTVIIFELRKGFNCVNGKLSKKWLRQLLECRNDHLNAFPFDTMQELETYANNANSPVFMLLNEFSEQVDENPILLKKRLELDHVASHLGKALGLVNVLRGLAFNAMHQRCYIPSELLSKHNYSHENIIRCLHRINRDGQEKAKLDSKLVDIIFDIASEAMKNNRKAKLLLDENGLNMHKTNNIFLPLLLNQWYLEDLEKYEFNVIHKRLTKRGGLLPFSLWWATKK